MSDRPTGPVESPLGSQEAKGADVTLKTLEAEYVALFDDLASLKKEIRTIQGLRVKELAEQIRRRRLKLLALEKKIFLARQMELFPKSHIPRRKRRSAEETESGPSRESDSKDATLS